MSIPCVFISYAWESSELRAWVKLLAVQLRADGIESILDFWETVPGDQLPAFMERAIRESDYVIIICTPEYKARSDSRTGGVGYEGDILTAHVLAGTSRQKFIPILRGQSWFESAPDWVLGSRYVDLRGKGLPQEGYRDLLDTILGRRPTPPPVSGPSINENTRLVSSRLRDGLNELGPNLAQLARRGTLSPPLALKRYIRAIIRVLNQHLRNHALLVGPAGVGKTLAIEGLAFYLSGSKQSHELCVISSTAQTTDGFPKILMALTEKDQLLICLENLHLSMASDAEGLVIGIRHIIEKTHCRIIATITTEGYSAQLKGQQLIKDYFTIIEFSEPSLEESREIVRHACQALEKHHGISVTDDAIEAAVRLTTLHLSDGTLPGKALHLIDEACAYSRFPSTAATNYMAIGGVVDENVVRYVLARRLGVEPKELDQ
jgi:hypothetical protein